jgi:putative peptidoglycan lipid II flippase
MPSLARSVGTVGANTLLSRILGFVRDLVTAQVFGAGALTDAFFVAFKIPNFLRRLFAEGAFSTAFVPVLSEYRAKRTEAELKLFVDHVAGTLGLALLLVTALGMLAAPLVVTVFAPGFTKHGEVFDLTSRMLQITFPYILFISLTAFCGGILNAHHRFGIPAFTPVWLNLAMIAAAWWLAPVLDEPITALAWAVLLAGVVQFAFQLPFVHRIGLMPRFRPAPRDPGVMRVLKLMVPALFGVSVAQISLLIDTLIASFLEAGSISWLYYSDRLMEFPLGILGAALATVILPNLSRRHAEESPDEFSRTLDWGLRAALVFGVPASVGLFLLAGPMTAALFMSGEFDAHDVLMSERSLRAYSLGLTAFILVKILAPGFYARQDTRTPVKFAAIALGVNMLLNLMLVWHLRHAGLALSTTLAAVLNAALLFRALRRQGVYRPPAGWRLMGLRIGAASVVMGSVLWWGAGDLSHWLTAPRSDRLIWLATWILAGGVGYFATLLALGMRVADLRGRHAPS